MTLRSLKKRVSYAPDFVVSPHSEEFTPVTCVVDIPRPAKAENLDVIRLTRNYVDRPPIHGKSIRRRCVGFRIVKSAKRATGGNIDEPAG